MQTKPTAAETLRELASAFIAEWDRASRLGDKYAAAGRTEDEKIARAKASAFLQAKTLLETHQAGEWTLA
jgi:hypothetical protein